MNTQATGTAVRADLAAAPAQAAGGSRLIYLMGPSGSGKDSLLRVLRDKLQDDGRVRIAQRYITRASSADEASIAITQAEFERCAAQHGFALHWRSHGLCYGIGIELDAWLAQGLCVVVNGSREHLAAAHARYPALHAVQISVRLQVLGERLRLRGREDEQAIVRRLQRAGEPFAVPAGCRLTVIDNSGALETAAQALLRLTREGGHGGKTELTVAGRS
ncbi:phosphonate metabolism protein/1,5-bisphosphokinase (PRPP-forming) PhnN [Cupriavidus basilensis]|uniref:phosphonate metabolism protein/1,5-bisphosphokinase (PRPP-forming) PhnN n=1 Tax=Cupriavidus basilensis TaxID=68895 RepID=UPI0023E88D08|nr:phosphonate metabolism protein/1,5-bisphosphokinase (PRPP-forming) PhnN [Cupriavidus basilensis]MDF3883711.1 phosphonate metabolism protein/1,5-bisphosphokinase (PRPP-forming) PhnN [Cupriavidus basilensis]